MSLLANLLFVQCALDLDLARIRRRLGIAEVKTNHGIDCVLDPDDCQRGMFLKQQQIVTWGGGQSEGECGESNQNDRTTV